MYRHLSYIFDAFSELDTERNYRDITRVRVVDGITKEEIVRVPMPIPFNSIVQYARIYKYDDEFEEFLYLIRQVDNSYIEMLSGLTNA